LGLETLRVLGKSTTMQRTGLRLLWAVFLLVVDLVGFPTKGRAGDVVRLAFSSLSATNAGFLTAIEEKLFEKRGIELIPVYIASSSIALAAVLTREGDFATLSGEAAVRALIIKGRGAWPSSARNWISLLFRFTPNRRSKSPRICAAIFSVCLGSAEVSISRSDMDFNTWA
jgi:hypothetical protein